MKRIALLSDTHGCLDDKILSHLRDVDEIWHAGDFGDVLVSDQLSSLLRLRGVFGNIDGQDIRNIHPEFLSFTCEGVQVLMVHIGGPFGTYNPFVRGLMEAHRPDLFICGHSHILKVMRDEKRSLIYMNPGAAGKHGFHKIRTMLLFNIESKQLKDLRVVELGLRGGI